jgi:hypothetical protein
MPAMTRAQPAESGVCVGKVLLVAALPPELTRGR